MARLARSRRVGRVGLTVLDEGIYRTADGQQRVCAVVRRPDAVAVLPVWVSPEGVRFVLLVRQPRPAVSEAGLWEAVAGTIDYGESAADAAVRTLREETGRQVARLHLLAEELYVSPGYSTERLTILAATLTDTITGRRPEDVDITADWAPLEELPLIRDLKTVLALRLAVNTPELWPVGRVRINREGRQR